MTTTNDLEEEKAGASYWLRQFQLQQEAASDLSAKLRDVVSVLDEVEALHQESKFMTTVSYCSSCTELFPCKTRVTISRLRLAHNDTDSEGVQL